MVESLDGETWRDIGVVDGVDMSGLYIVSDFGRIFMFERDYYRKDGVKVHAKEKFVPYHDNGTGYLYGCLFNDEISRKFYVHRVVATVYIPNPDPEHKTDVNHLDENKYNNRANNLTWSTPMENNNWGTHAERISESQSKTPTLQIDMNGNIVHRWKSAREAHKYGWNYNVISAVLTGKYFSCSYKGYVWMRESDYIKMGRENVVAYCIKADNERKIVQLDTNMNIVRIWDCMEDAVKNGYCIKCVSACMKGKRELYKDFKWMTLNDYKSLFN